MKTIKTLALVVMAMFLTENIAAQLPSVTLKTIEGKTINTAKLSNDGKPFVITFFATWCKPCQRELKAIHEVYADWQDETGMKVVAVSIDEGQNVNKVKPLVDASGWEYEVLLDANGDFKRAMGVGPIPALFIVDGNGKIVDQHSGYTDGSEEEIIAKIRSLLKK